MLFTQHGNAAPAPGSIPPCQIFRRIGQPCASCEDFGGPYREHLCNPLLAGQKPLLHVRQFRHRRGEGTWQLVGSMITRAGTQAVRNRWADR